MKNTKSNDSKSNKAAPRPNKTAAQLKAERSAPKPMPKTLAEFYKHAYNTLLNKLSKEAKENISLLMTKPLLVIRGSERFDPELHKFIKNVAEMGEALFDKAQKAAKTDPKPAA